LGNLALFTILTVNSATYSGPGITIMGESSSRHRYSSRAPNSKDLQEKALSTYFYKSSDCEEG